MPLLVQNVRLSPTGPPQATPLTLSVVTPLGPLPVRVFQQSLYLRFAAGGADALTPTDATQLRAAFQPYDYNSLSSTLPWPPATLAASDGAALVTLDAPRRIVSIRLNPDLATAGERLELYRVVDQSLADKPTASAPLNGNLQAVFPSDPVAPGSFLDTRFAVRLQGSGGPRPLAANGLAEVRVRAFPANVRLGLAAPGAEGQAVVFWPPSVAGAALPTNPTSVDASAALVAALRRFLDGLARPLSEVVEVALVVMSDAPCRLTINNLSLAYHRVADSFPNQAPKTVLRFAGAQATTQTVTLSLPRSAVVASAVLRVSESFRPHRLAAPTSPSDGGPNVVGAPDDTQGLYVGLQRWVGQPIKLASAVMVTGVAIAVLPLTDQTELQVELQEDWHGMPSGRRLAGGVLTPPQVGERASLNVLFRDPITLPAQPHWLLVKASQGEAVWLTQPSAGSSLVLEQADPNAPWRLMSSVPGVQAVYQWLQPTEGDTAAQVPSGVTLSLGSRVVPGVPQGDGTTRYDLAAALAAYLASPALADPAAIALDFTSALAGLVTVYPPHIEYD